MTQSVYIIVGQGLILLVRPPANPIPASLQTVYRIWGLLQLLGLSDFAVCYSLDILIKRPGVTNSFMLPTPEFRERYFIMKIV